MDGEAIVYTVVRSPRRRKTMTITLDAREGVVVAVPARTSAADVRDLIVKRAGWIRHHLAARGSEVPTQALAERDSLLYLSLRLPLVFVPVAARRVAVAFDGEIIEIRVAAHLEDAIRDAAIEQALIRWYRVQAADELVTRTAHWSELAGCTPCTVLIRDQRRRWASCNADGTLRFNWRLVMAPPTLIDYVVVHELAHLHVRNHSPAFWEEVARLMPDYRLRRTHLKQIGPTLAL